MFCRNCGNELRPGSKFCRHCGKSVDLKNTQDQMPQYSQQSDYSQQHKKPQSKFPVALIITIILASVIAVITVLFYLARVRGNDDNGQVSFVSSLSSDVQDKDATTEPDERMEQQEEIPIVQPEWVGLENVPEIDPGPLSDYLNETEKIVYELETAYLEGKSDIKSISIENEWNSSPEDWRRIEYAVENEAIYSGYLPTYSSVKYYPADREVRIEEIRDPGKDFKAVDQVVRSVAEGLTGTASEKVRQIHDYLCENVQLDYNSDMMFTPYGALIEHKAVCNGYSSAFAAICREADIPCYQLWGEAGGGRHAWNIVRLEDGNWYEIDVLWDDNDPGNPYYYFCIPTSKMSESHTRSQMGGFEEIIPVTQE